MKDSNETVANGLVNRWAEARLDLPAGSVVSVDVDYGEGGAWSSWTFEDPHFYINANLADGQRKWIEHDFNFAKVLGELGELAEKPVDD